MGMGAREISPLWVVKENHSTEGPQLTAISEAKKYFD